MKRFLCITLAALMVFSMASCGNGEINYPAGAADGNTTELTAEVLLSATPPAPDRYCAAGEYDSIRALGMELFKETASLSDEENLLISPVSVMMALAMAAQGAEAETLEEIEAAAGKDAVFFGALMADYAHTIMSDNETAKVSVADSVWLRDDPERLTVKEDFLAKCVNLGAEVYKSAFNEGTVKDVNKWVEEYTDGMIDSIIDEVKESEVIYLINALSFDNEWERPYKSYETGSMEFLSADGSRQETEFMFSGETVFLRDDKATGFIKPYKDNFSFVAILPNEGITTDEYIASMDENTLKNLMEGGKDVPVVQTALPKFSSGMFMDMAEVMKKLGLGEMFGEDTADFKPMAESARGNIFISKVAHKTFIEVDTEGTRAAAVTQVAAEDGAAMMTEEVILNRPFIYMIVDGYANSSLPLFIGTVENMN